MNAPCLVFHAGPVRCAVPLARVVETMRPLPVRPLAAAPPYLLGMSVVRGTVVPVIDVAALVGGVRGDAATRLVTVRGPWGTAALATGPVVGIAAVALPDAEPGGSATPAARATPEGAATRSTTSVTVSDGEPLLVLEVDAVVPPDAHAVLPAGAGAP